jgi:hypothetical protein
MINIVSFVDYKINEFSNFRYVLCNRMNRNKAKKLSPPQLFSTSALTL